MKGDIEVAQVIEHIVEAGAAGLYENYLKKNEVPYASSRCLEEALRVVAWAYLRRDEGPNADGGELLVAPGVVVVVVTSNGLRIARIKADWNEISENRRGNKVIYFVIFTICFSCVLTERTENCRSEQGLPTPYTVCNSI